MKTITNKVLVLAFIAHMVVSSTGIVSAQSYEDLNNTSFVDTSVSSGDGFNFVDYDPSSPVSYDAFNNSIFTNPYTYYSDTSCVGCGSTVGNTGYNFVNYDPSTTVNYSDFNNTTFTNPSTYYGDTSCVGCGTSYTTPYISDNSYYSSTNYGVVDYGSTNYGTIDYGYTGGSSWTGVIITGGNGGTSCPAGSSWVNGTCQINTITCPNGTHRVNNTCVVDTTTCPTGSSLVNGVCQVNQTNCPNGTHRVNNTCVVDTTTCPAGSTLVNGVCQINTTTCPTGSTLINGVCQAPITCPAGTTYQNGTCVGQGTTVCPAGSTLMNGVCQINTTSCPAGSQLQNGICVVQTTSYTCPNGQIVSNLYACPVTYGQTSYSYTTMPIVYQTCWNGTTIPNTSVCPAQYKVCANGTSIPIYQQCYVAQLPVYVPPPVIKFNNVVTSPVTQITNISARCNGIGLIAQNAQSTGWFEYGQTTNLGRSTAQAIIGSAPTSPFSNVLTNLQPSTDYYCRAVMQNQYGLVKGEIVKFTTKGKVSTYVQPAPKKKTTTVTKTTTAKKSQIICIDGSIVSVGSQTSATMLNEGQKLIAVQLEKVTGDLQVGGNATYRMTYKNLSDSSLSGVEIKIVVPQELTVTNVPTGGYDVSTHTITFGQLSIAPYSQNVIEWSGAIAKNAPIGKTVVTTAYLIYTVPGTNVQDEVTAYTASSIGQPTDVGKLSGDKNVIGTGSSFLPESLVEWLALIAILFILFILGRSIANSYKKGGEAHH